MWPSFPFCPHFAPFSSIRQPDSLLRFPQPPLPQDLARLSPAAHILCFLASFWLTCSFLSLGRPASCALLSLVWVFPRCFLFFPLQPLWLFLSVSLLQSLCSSQPKPDFVFSCQLLSKLGPLGVLLFLNRSSCAFCWPTQLFLSLTTEVMSFVTINRK